MFGGAFSAERLAMPAAVYVVCILEIFAIISFAVLFSTLVLYAHDQIGLSKLHADLLVGVFMAYNFGLHFIAGVIGGKYISYRGLLIICLAMQLVGCILLYVGGLHNFYLGLAGTVVGSGSMVTCINMLIGQNFQQHDQQRERAFYWAYSALNVGLLCGFAMSGYLQLLHNFRLLFMFAGLSNVLSIVVMGLGWHRLADQDTVISKVLPRIRAQRAGLVLVGMLGLVPVMYELLQMPALGDAIILLLGGCMIFVLGYLIWRLRGQERALLLCFVVLILAAQAFFIIYQLAPMGLMWFARLHVDLHLMGMQVAPAWLPDVNSFTIIFAAPLLGIFFRYLRNKYAWSIAAPEQFVVGLFVSGVGLWLLRIGIGVTLLGGLVAFGWLVGYVILQSLAELLIAPVSFAMVGRLLPARWQSMAMGMVLLNSGVAAIFASNLSNVALGVDAASGVRMAAFAALFSKLAIMVWVVCLILLCLLPWLRRILVE